MRVRLINKVSFPYHKLILISYHKHYIKRHLISNPHVSFSRIETDRYFKNLNLFV